MLKNRDIILISSVDWNFLWQGPQEIAQRLACSGNRVLFIENTGVRAPGFGDVRRLKNRIRRWLQTIGTRGIRKFAPGGYICSPLVLPPFGSSRMRQLNRNLFIPAIVGAAIGLDMNDPILWTYLPTDTAEEIIRQLRTKSSLVIYYCAADFARLTPHVEALRRSEINILRQSDVVFATCSGLARHCENESDNVHKLFPNAVDLSAFPVESSALGESSKPREPVDCLGLFESISRPVIGYIGGLHRYVDLDLLREMIRARPQWSWVFVGPIQVSTGAIAFLPNVHILGPRQHRELVHYVRAFDVGIVPYIKNDYTRTVVPVKINEYLAVGKPVVSTNLEPVMEFNAVHDVILTSDNQPHPYLQAIERALVSGDDSVECDRRRRVASLSDWGIRMDAICQFIEAKL